MRIHAVMRMSLAFAGIVVGVVLLGLEIGFLPDPKPERAAARAALCEKAALECSIAAERGDRRQVDRLLSELAGRRGDLAAARLQSADERWKVTVGEPIAEETMDRYERAAVPILRGAKSWGRFEAWFDDARLPHAHSGLASPIVRLALFCGALAFLSFLLYLRRTIEYLDPAAVVPERVRRTLDTLSEGVVVVGPDERIVLANQAFATRLGEREEKLLGRRLEDLGFRPVVDDGTTPLPWVRSLRNGKTTRSVQLTIDTKTAAGRTFSVNSAPIIGSDEKCSGALVTFDDVTLIERRNKQLRGLVATIKQSRDEIRQQNEQLTLLATCDPLTGCYNRRYLYSQLNELWPDALAGRTQLGFVLLDIDHFKSINDNHGHAVGDLVLQSLGKILKELGAMFNGAVVARYGGEEFCLAVPGADLERAIDAAEQVRTAVAAEPLAGIAVTCSLGVSVMADGAALPDALIEQADKALYCSKQGGRNRTTSFSQVPRDFRIESKTSKRHEAPQASSASSASPLPLPAPENEATVGV